MPTFLRPIAGPPRISCNFACHLKRSSVNPGVDYAVGSGTDVLAPADGVVNYAQWSNSVGWWLGIEFDNGWGADLMHNSKLLVKPGQRVTAGQHIAESGGTGTVATGPHVHWSLRPVHGWHLQNHGNVNPEKYLTSAAGGGGAPIPPAPPERKARPQMASLYAEADASGNAVNYALAGDSPGTEANWIEVTAAGGLSLANGWSLQIGAPSIVCNRETFLMLKARYLTPVKTSGGSGGTPAPVGPVDLTPGSIKAVADASAEATATELHNRTAQ